MLFCSQKFLLFFLIVFSVYWAMPWQRARVYLLLIASFVFYAAWNEWLAVLIVVSSTADYCIARIMDASTRSRVRRLLLTTSILFNLGILCYFKYANFFLRSLEDALRATGASSSLPVLSVILPIGISFYTFEAISYAVDVYRRKIRAERSLAHFMLFILFFPHLIAGPIVRGSDFLPQIRRKKRWNWLRMSVGVQLFLLGMVKKLVIADRMAMLADPVFADPAIYHFGALWAAVLAYAIQIYCDFSGYSDMALGTAHLLGYRLAINFNMPYLAVNIADFWRRWHISLSNWLRDYVFIPLGGSRCSAWQTFRNLLIVMGLGGLWHGANWTFFVWGLTIGGWLCLHRAFREYVEKLPTLNAALQSPLGTTCRILLTFVGVSFTWVIFRSPTLGHGLAMLRNMLTPTAGMNIPFSPHYLWAAVAAMALGHALGQRELWKRVAARLPSPVMGFGHAAILTAVILSARGDAKSFVYFQF